MFWCLKRQRYVFLFWGLLLVGACREEGIRLRRAEPVEMTAVPPVRHRSSPAQALLAMDLAAPCLAGTQTVPSELAAAYRLIRRGGLLPAENRLEKTLRLETTGELVQPAINLLGELLFYRQQWEQFLEYAPRYVGMIANDVPLAKAYRAYPPERRQWDEAPVTVPLRAGVTGAPQIEVAVGGKSEWFWLDTGTGITVLSQRTARQLGVTTAGDETAEAATATSRKIVVRPAVIPRLEVGGISLVHHRAVIVADEDLTFRFKRTPAEVRIRGILGWNFIRQFAVAINVSRREVILRRSEHTEQTGGNLFWLGYPVVQVRSPAGEVLYFGLDTGAESTVLSSDFAERHEGLSTGRRQRWRLTSAGGEQVVESAVLEDVSLRMESWEITFSHIRTREIRSTEYIALDGILGADLLRLGTVLIDGPGGSLTLRPVRPVADGR
ncbi:MAG: aspartyl protease family protein [Acidobacteria bacterium]|nr:aspartyl protease family protein [Acidobacteriota bacterium]